VQKKIEEAGTIWTKWMAVAVVNDDPPPANVVRAIEDDFNTPAALVAMGNYASEKRGRELYAAMKYLGLLPQDGEEIPLAGAPPMPPPTPPREAA